MKSLKFFILLSLLVSFNSLAWPFEGDNAQQAIEFVKNYKAASKSDTVLDTMANIFAAAANSGTKIDVGEWESRIWSREEYYVSFTYAENGEPKTFKFLVNLNTNKITGMNRLTKKFLKYIENK